MQLLAGRLRDFSKAGWESLLTLSEQQAVTALIGVALSDLAGQGLAIPDSISTKLMLEMDRTECNARRVRTLAGNLVAAMQRAGLHPVLMKGPSVAQYYPQPDMRTPGDIDIYLPPGEWDEALSRLTVRGEPVAMAPDGSAHFLLNGVDIDLHSRYYDLIFDGKSLSGLPPVPSTEATMLMLSLHILKHAIGPGVGIRQVCDYAMAWRALEGDFNPETLSERHRRLGTIRWHHLLNDFVSRRLCLLRQSGSPAFHPERSGESSPLETIIFSGGNFGHYSAARDKALAGSALSRKTDTLKRSLRRIPFALKYAPRAYFAYIKTLAAGNLHKMSRH